MTHLLAFFAGAIAGILVMCIVAVSGDDRTSTVQGPQTPPADPNDTEWHVV